MRVFFSTVSFVDWADWLTLLAHLWNGNTINGRSSVSERLWLSNNYRGRFPQRCWMTCNRFNCLALHSLFHSSQSSKSAQEQTLVFVTFLCSLALCIRFFSILNYLDLCNFHRLMIPNIYTHVAEHYLLH